MRALTDRHEIAAVMNFNKFPVLTIDMNNHKGYGDGFAEGQKVRVAWDRKEKRYEGMTSHANLIHADGEFHLNGGCACLSAGFGYADVIEMSEWAHAPVVHAGQMVVVIMNYTEEHVVIVRMMKVSPRINIHCMTIARLEDLDDEANAELDAYLREFKRNM